MTQACPGCGAPNAASNHFCTRCGRALELPPPVTPPVVAQPPPARKLCAGCRTVNEQSSSYCYRCGLKLPDSLYTLAEAIGNPGGFWARLTAYIIDDLLLAIVGLLLTTMFTGMELEEALKQLIGESEGWTATAITVGLGAAYYTFAIGQWGQTVGKAVLGLKVTRADGSRLSYWRSFARYWAYLVSLVPLGLGFISIGLSPHKRGWHDFICGTRVVELRR